MIARARGALLFCVGAAAVLSCGDATTGPDPIPWSGPSSVQLGSDAGDYIGAGRTYSYSHANAVMTVEAEGRTLFVRIDGDEWWFGEFAGPSRLTRLERGTYTGLERYPFHNATEGGLSWSGEGRGCNTLTGSFTVHSVTYSGESLASIDLEFEQHCEGGTAALRGRIRWRADDDTRPPGPVNPIPASLWQPPSGITPATGDYVYLQSDNGDYIGAGGLYLYTEPDNAISVAAGTGHATVSVDDWYGDFQAMNTVTRLEVGYYPDLRRYPFHNPAKGGLSWSGHGRGCNELTGWFVVDRVTYDGVTLNELELRFEQHCEGMTPALRGKIRWTR